jgi:putative endonuclease
MAERLMALALPAGGGSAFGGKTIAYMFTVYILKSKLNNKLYVGYTEDIETRLKSHNSGKVSSTKAYRPYSLVYKEEFENKTDARKRELFLKSGKGREFIRSFIN